MERYDRNILIDGIGQSGQAKLQAAKVLVVGAGGLGSPVLYYLTAAGVGTLGIIDYDVVDLSNLQRQILHFTENVGCAKVDSAAGKLRRLNPEVNLVVYKEKLLQDNVRRIFSDYDFVVSCSDNYETKFLVNDVCVELKKPFSHGAALALRGEAMTYVPGHACYRCVFSDMPEEGTMPSSAQVGILGSVAGIIGSIQATEVIKYITEIDGLLLDRILIFDAKSMSFYTLAIEENPDCKHT